MADPLPFSKFVETKPKDGNRVNLLSEGMEIATPNTHFEVRNLLYWGKGVNPLKSDGGITIRLPSSDWEENERTIEAHCDAGAIIAKKGIAAQICICVPP